MDGSAASLQILYNHLVLPARLPGKQDDNLREISLALAERLLKATQYISRIQDNSFAAEWASLGRALQSCKLLHASGALDKEVLQRAFKELDKGDTLIIHVAEQNVALLVRYYSE
jgi:hypothetical protein